MAALHLHKHEFQSHAGSIEAQDLFHRRLQDLQFQSHAGSIEAEQVQEIPPAVGRFNPTLVRLRQLISASDLMWERGFNPTLVRLRP